ncbi:MAG TPA: alpha-(1-_3)-arabinofuranosyltransferase family protein [Streptosporangiaceae bacterium]|nr:alpha-(1->3)-arabinofuranosyltransferase family protein [Streptosporangiaceae bacterium]
MTIARDRASDSTRPGEPPDTITGRSARPASDASRPITRWVLLVWLVAFVILMANDSGRIFFDTKLGVDIDPASFLARLWQLWNPNEWLGSLQDQYIGYAFPMAPFYLVGELLKVPVWITERLWLSFLITVGFAGLVKLARAVGIGTDRSQIVAGIVFALWPTFTIVIGSTSAGIIPGLLAPWAVLPLVTGARGGSVVKAAARSGVAVLFMGGVNATSTLAALILPALFIVTQARGRRLIALAACWTGAVILATAWWIGPLLLQAKYSFNFLPYIEQSATTTATMSAATFLRGAGNWTAYLNLGQPWLSAGWTSVTNPFAIMAAAIAAGTGLLGLARRDIPCGGWLKLSLAVAALIALAGYPGALGGIFHSSVDTLLDGAAAPLRSVYKIEPAAAAILALGIAHVLVLRSSRAAIINDPAPRTLWHLIAAPVIGLVIVGLAYPYLSDQVLNPGSFKSVPSYWYQVASFLKTHSARAPALVVPAAAHGAYLWGDTDDEPLEPLASSPWVEQGLVPYGGAGSQLLLDSLESAVESGEQVPGLAATLARSGIRYIVVRNDLNPSALGYTSPQTVHQALASSGFQRVAAFGPLITGAQTDPSATQIQYALPSYPAVEVFEAKSALGTPMPPAATALPVSRTVLVNGGPDALLQLTGQHLLGSAPAVMAGDKLVASPATWVATDSLPRADHSFGLTDSTPSFTYTAGEDNPVDDPLGGAGGPPRQLLPVPAQGHQTLAVIAGAASVTASSSGSWLTETPQIDPVNAFDGDPSTYWTEASPTTPVGQWIQITFSRPIVLPPAIRVELLVDGAQRPVADELTVRTAHGSRTSKVRKISVAQRVRVAPGATRTLRITITGATGQLAGGPGAGITDVLIPGVTLTRYSAPAEDPAGQSAQVIAFSFHRQVPSPASLADVASYPPLARQIVTRSFASFKLTASAIAVPGQRLDALLAGLTPAHKHALEVTASSTWGSLPDLAPINLFKAHHQGSWIAGAGSPVLRLSWQGRRTISQLVILPVPGFGAAPESIKITSPNGVRFASVGLDGLTEIVPPLRTDRMSISFPVVEYATAGQSASGQPIQLPVGLSKLSIPALDGLTATTLAASTKFTLPCGRGPEITIDGHRTGTKVTGTVGDLTEFRPVKVTLCSPRSVIGLAPGRHRLLASRPSPFSITDLSLVSQVHGAAAGNRAASAQPRTVKILSWQSEYREVRIGPGARSYLEVHQNANAGWIATLHGRPLVPVQLDGWQQGFVVPAGAGGLISLTFAPDRFYHVWIILSAIGALALMAMALIRRRRRRSRDPMAGALDNSDRRALVAAGAHRTLWPAVLAWLGVAAIFGLVAIVGGYVALVVPVIAVLAYLVPRWYGLIALVAMVTTGVLAVVSGSSSTSSAGAFGAPAQVCALVALSVALLPVLRPGGARPQDRPRGRPLGRPSPAQAQVSRGPA